jgi:beta-glucosidase-like glycosyl hydrolase
MGEEKTKFLTRRKFLIGGAAASFTAAIAAEPVFRHYPDLQSPKNRVIPDFLMSDRYEIPNTIIDRPGLTAVNRTATANQRTSLEDRIAELLITRVSNLGDFTPGGILLTKRETRRGNLFGRYCSYDPLKTQRAVERIRALAAEAEQRILIHDEGEGGYVPRIGTLPPATHIGNYLENNEITATMRGMVESSNDRDERVNQVVQLFERYAQELEDRGVNVVLGPVVDVSRLNHEPDNFLRAADRVFSNRHLVVRPIAMLYSDTMHRHNIRVTGKHFLSSGLPISGDSHDDLVRNRVSRGDTPLRWAMNTYADLKEHFDAVMVSHVINPFDDLPYSISPRSIRALTQEIYDDENHRGVNFTGLVMVDDISMRGLVDYVERMNLDERQRALLEGTESGEVKAAVLAIDAGAHTVIALQTDTDEIVRMLTRAYKIDNRFKEKVDIAFEKYELFADRF